MRGTRLQIVLGALLSLYTLRCLPAEAQTDDRAHAAEVLAQHFDTVAYTDTDLLTRFDSPNDKTAGGDLAPRLPLALRLPFVQLIGGLKMVGERAVSNLEHNYSGVLVGAKNFTPPDGIGMVSSQDCYIGIPKVDGRSLIDSDFSDKTSDMIDEHRIWTWSAPPYEGYPHQTTFYLTELKNRYLILSNSVGTLRETIRYLTTDNSVSSLNADKWDPPSSHGYWIYRTLRWSKTEHDADATGSGRQISDSIPLRFAVDADINALKVHVKADTLNKAFKASELPIAEVIHYEPASAGVWKATFPLAGDAATTTSLFKMLYLFGFGVAL